MENRRSSILLEHSIYHLNSDERLRESRVLPFTQPFNRIQVADARATLRALLELYLRYVENRY